MLFLKTKTNIIGKAYPFMKASKNPKKSLLIKFIKQPKNNEINVIISAFLELFLCKQFSLVKKNAKTTAKKRIPKGPKSMKGVVNKKNCRPSFKFVTL